VMESELTMLSRRIAGIRATIARSAKSVDGPLSDGAVAMIRSLERRRDELQAVRAHLLGERKDG
jgi:hypothetical protein